MRLFLDTNIVIDFCVERVPFYEAAAGIIELARRSEVTLAVSSLTIVNTAYVLRKVLGWEAVYPKLLQLMELIAVSPVDDYVVRMSVSSGRKDFEDSIQYYSALKSESDLIVTRDKSGFSGLSLEALTADEFLQRCR